MTVLEALKSVRADLGQIPVRIVDFETIGNPLRAAVANLGAIIDALEKAEAEKDGADNEQQG